MRRSATPGSSSPRPTGVGPVAFGRLIGRLRDRARRSSPPASRRGVREARGRGRGRRRRATGSRPMPPRAIATAAARPAAPILGPVRRSRRRCRDPRRTPATRRGCAAIALPPPVLYVRGRPRRSTGSARSPSSARGARRRSGGRTRGADRRRARRRSARRSSPGSRWGSTAPRTPPRSRAGGTTVAVIGGGHDRLYPAAHRGLARRDRRRRRSGRQRVRARDRRRRGARSRGATGSSAASRTRRSSSRPAPGAAR